MSRIAPRIVTAIVAGILVEWIGASLSQTESFAKPRVVAEAPDELVCSYPMGEFGQAPQACCASVSEVGASEVGASQVGTHEAGTGSAAAPNVATCDPSGLR